MNRARSIVWAAAAALFSFSFLTAAWSADEARRVSEPRRDQLVDLVTERRDQVSALENSLAELSAEVAGRAEEIGRRTAEDRAAAEAARVLAMQAGAVAMAGPGIVVEMADSARVPGPGEDPSLYRVHDVDLQLVVNAAFLLGAEAVAVDDQRLVSTSAVRGAGETILVNFRPLVPPYRIAIVGVSREPFMSHPVSRRLGRWEDLFGLGFKVSESDEVEVPAYSGQRRLRHADPGRAPAPPAGGRT